MDGDLLRTTLAAHLRQSGSASLVALGRSVEGPGCWGTLVESLEQLCTADGDYLGLFDVLVGLGDARALLLFLSAARERTAVLEQVVRRAPELPRTVQCTLVTLPEVEPLLEQFPTGCCAAAQELLESPRERLKSGAVYAAHMGVLRSMMWGKQEGGVP